MLVSVGFAVLVGTGVEVLLAVAVLTVETGEEVLLAVAVLTGVTVTDGMLNLLVGCGSFGLLVAPDSGKTPPETVGVTVIVPEARIVEVVVCKAVDEGTGVAVGTTAGEFVGVKKRTANASCVSTRSSGVAVAVNLGVSTISGLVSNLSPPSTNGI